MTDPSRAIASPASDAASAPTLHPADIFRATPRESQPQGGEFPVVRTRQSRLRALAWWIVPAALLCTIPAIVAWWRPEPTYLVGGAWLIALLCAVAVLVIGAALAWFAPIGRTGTVLNLSDDAIILGPAAGTEQARLPWERVRRCEIAGRFSPTLIIAVADEPEPEPAPEQNESDEADEPEPEPLPALDFEADPPPPTVQPSREVFEQIRPLEAEEPKAGAEAEEVETEPEPTPKPRRGQRWNEHFYGTPYAISLWATSPQAADLQSAIEAYSAGRFAASSRRSSRP